MKPDEKRADAPPRRKARPCPICGRPSTPALRPFCSAECADRDLHRWLSDKYAIRTIADEDDKDGGYGPS
ncbi:MAG: DNA gyrase inhibitor YacG [Bauldia sp.]